LDIASELMGMTPSDVNHPDDRRDQAELIAALLRGDTDELIGENASCEKTAGSSGCG
jgi:hypothetical protein